MELSQHQKELFESRLKAVADKNPRCMECPICGSKHFNIKTSEYSLLSLEHKNGAVIPAEMINVLPVAALVCKTCRNVRLFSLED